MSEHSAANDALPNGCCHPPADHTAHVQHTANKGMPRECPDKACAATGPEGCRYSGWMLCGYPILDNQETP